MARTNEKYKKVSWCSFRIPRDAWLWLGQFRANYGMDFQSVLALALEIGAEKGLPKKIERMVGVKWQTACVETTMHERMKEMALDNGVKLQDVGAALLAQARPVMKDKQALIQFIGGRDWPAGFKLTAQVENLAVGLDKLVEWEGKQ